MTSQKTIKSNKSRGKEEASREFACKFRGKYDLNKNMKNKELNLENAVNLCEVILAKNENLFKSTIIKMNNKKKLFTFKDKNSFTKVRHHVSYEQVKKFFVLHKDPSMVIMGVIHKNQQLFLVFQFQNKEDLKQFCDEIEGDTQNNIIEKDNENPVIDDVYSMPVDVEIREHDNSSIERLSIHSKAYNENLKIEDIDFTDSFYEPDLEPETFAVESSFLEEGTFSTAASTESLDDEKTHCDNIGQSKLTSLFISKESDIYGTCDDWKEEIILLDDPTIPGSAYIYCARQVVCYAPHGSADYNDDEDADNHFYNHTPKIIQNDNDEDSFQNHEPKLNNSFNNHEPKMITKANDNISINDGMDNFHNHEPKLF